MEIWKHSKQVDDIGKLVDEFSSFARMPEAEIKLDNLSETFIPFTTQGPAKVQEINVSTAQIIPKGQFLIKCYLFATSPLKRKWLL